MSLHLIRQLFAVKVFNSDCEHLIKHSSACLISTATDTAWLVGCQEEHPACKKRYLSGVRCRLSAYGPADAAASLNHVNSCLI